MSTKNIIILEAAHVALVAGVESVTQQAVADRLNMSRQAVAWHFKTNDDLRGAVEAFAFEANMIPIMAQAVTGKRSAAYPVTAAQLSAIAQWIGGRVNAAN